MNNFMLIFLGGGLGSLTRYGISELVRNNFKTGFPFATLFSNIISCVILALTISFLTQKQDSLAVRSFIIIGFCGGFSTFSSFSFETMELLRSGNWIFAFLNVMIFVVACL